MLWPQAMADSRYPHIGPPRVPVADIGREKLQKAAMRPLAGGGYQAGTGRKRGCVNGLIQHGSYLL